MKAEKEFKRENGDIIKLRVILVSTRFMGDFRWEIDLWKKEYRKRKFSRIDCHNRYGYLKFPQGGKEREDYRLWLILSHVSIEEIQEVKMMIVEQIKESIEKI